MAAPLTPRSPETRSVSDRRSHAECGNGEKKARGVYYTPTYIVDYIVQNTLGKLVEGRSPHEVAGRTEKWSRAKNLRPLAVLDPACGAGVFLIGAYQFLLDWYRDWYVAHDSAQYKDRIYQTRQDQWRLTAAERKRILLDHIYGVDIDPQAVEVAKLSLLLKVLEGENQESLDRQLRLFRQRALSDLADNIKCGNSVIGPDFYDKEPTKLFDVGDRARINVFDWRSEFREIVQAGGFDAVIGNPPWGQKAIEDDDALKHYVWQKYPSAKGIYDMFRPFVECGVRLTAQEGMFGMVLPDIVLLKNYQETRQFLLEQLSLEAVDWWGMAFASATIDAATIIGRKRAASAEQRVRVAVRDPEAPLQHEIRQADFWKNPRLTFNLFLTPQRQARLRQLESCPKLGEFFEVHEGVHSGNIRRELFVESRLDDTCRPLLFGRGEIAPYLLRWKGKYIRLGAMPQSKTRQRYANLGRPAWHERDKALVRRTGDYVLAAVDREGRYASNNFFLVFPRRPCALDLDGLCALLNSRLMTWYFRAVEPRRGRAFAELKIKHLTAFPLPPPALAADGCHALNELGARRRQLAEAAHAASGADGQAARRLADHLDEKIQALVLALFGLEADFEPEERIISGRQGDERSQCRVEVSRETLSDS